jgi:hypothetical protein
MFWGYLVDQCIAGSVQSCSQGGFLSIFSVYIPLLLNEGARLLCFIIIWHLLVLAIMVNKFAIWVEIFMVYNVYLFYRVPTGNFNGLGKCRNQQFEKAKPPV